MSAKPLLTVLQVAAVFGGARGLHYSPTLVRALTRIPTHTLIPLSSALYLHVMGTPSELCWQGGLSLSAYFTQVCRLSSRPLPLQSAGCQLDWQLASGWPSRHVLGNNFSDKEPSGSDSNWPIRQKRANWKKRIHRCYLSSYHSSQTNSETTVIQGILCFHFTFLHVCKNWLYFSVCLQQKSKLYESTCC